jgi:16S rRNA (cytidine1402-2'-O)-methyltransferase
LSHETATLVFFESSHRIKASIDDMAAAFGEDREAAVCREITKKFETVLRGTLADIQSALSSDQHQSRGEFVVLISGSDDNGPPIDGLGLAKALRAYLSASQAAKVAAKVTGASRRDLYKALENS